MASAVERSWLEPTHTVVEHLLDPENGSVRAVSREYYDALILVERPAPAEPGEVERLLVDLYLSRPVPDPDEQTLRRSVSPGSIWRRGNLPNAPRGESGRFAISSWSVA